MRSIQPLVLAIGIAVGVSSAHADPAWSGYGNNAQHTALAPAPSDSLSSIRWSVPVDTSLSPTHDPLLIHYGSPLITEANTIIVPVKTTSSGGFQLRALDAATGAEKWNVATDYILPPHNWIPSYSPTLTSANRLYYPGAGGTVYFRDNPDSLTPTAPTQIAFFGNGNYSSDPAAFNSNVFINTPITSDSSGNVYFGFRVTGTTPLGAGFTSGIARIAPDGSTTYTSAAAAAGDAAIKTAVMNCAPAISNDGSKLYIAVSQTPTSSAGKLVQLDSATLAPVASASLKDPKSGNNALLSDNGTSSPMIGPDGDVYYGVLESPFPSNNYRGWMLHFSPDLSQSKTAGAFGWDDTASVVPASMVPSYTGSSSYLLMTKYNLYAQGPFGDGVNKLAILDPNATMVDPLTGATVMQEILTIAGVTPDDPYVNNGFPNAVREWCINTAVVDPTTHSVLANSEDGKLYRWDLWTNTFTQVIKLTDGLLEAYTPTLVGPDGAVYAINDATLFSVVPEPTAGAIILGALLVAALRPRKRGSSRESSRCFFWQATADYV